MACATYGSDLLSAPLEGQAGAAGEGGSAGSSGSAAGTAAAGAGGSQSGGSAGNVAAEAGAPATPTTPYLSAQIGEQPASVALTTEGSLDWAHWGLAGVTDYNHKAAVTSQLLDFKPVGGKSPEPFVAGATTFTWSDGVPTASGSTNDGIVWPGLHEGFQLVVPAVAEARRLRLYIGVNAGTGRIHAELSDPRATTKVNTPVISAKQAWVLQVVSLEYGGCDMPNTTLDVSLQVEAMVAPSAAVSVSAIAIDNP
jgi:hypothetical protein